MEDSHFRRLLELLGFSWRGYRKVRKGIKKRIVRHMQEQDCRTMGDYLELLGKNQEVRGQCERLMSVSISRFFRDQRLWEVLKGEVLPELIKKCGDRVLVWSAGCARGEEVYSFKILWEHMNRCGINLPALDIMASDLNPLYLQSAIKALYPKSSLRETPESFIWAYFHPQSNGKRFRIKSALKKNIVWLTRDLFSGPPGSGFHLIFTRNNLLTYYTVERIGPLLNEIIESLSANGYMVIGSHEKLPIQYASLQPLPSLPYIFKKRG